MVVICNNLTISMNALVKIHLHSFKYTSSTINGIILGNISKNQNTKDDPTLKIQDIIPLFHTNTLSPMFEVAMIQIEEYCKVKNLDILGYYHANQNLTNELDPEPIAKKIADKLYNELHSMCFLMVTKIDADNYPIGLAAMERQSVEQWRSNKNIIGVDITENAFQVDDIKLIISQSLKDRLIFDFEDYLNDPTKDWLENKKVLIK
ncbi:hypothetical protein DLAC_11500 [Tieghemostelium lacteum]|uniref:MPN domain-containing protein n=1 Tax=Tieghemostelium lacteum TaxID=361077 RepID=A0A152A529_TIELA|nr:hypothetical protein DLAC_11500 [Tieghemostelium lacteum]|eukprot:KYR01346.1 hypothetical protein DLAC_11500 [Tieghemostelium lacteum]